jgi:transcriptional regulator with XRE-family HTH domain
MESRLNQYSPNDLDAVVGDRIRRQREACGLSQGQLGLYVLRSQSVISDLELGRRSIRLSDVRRIAVALGCDYNALVSLHD